MVGFIGFLILVFIGGFLALMLNGIFVAARKKTKPVAVFNQEMITAQDPVLETVPKRAVADSHWHVKTFMRPRRKRV